jgi:iron(III) transport system substrate-binding protein
MRHLARAALAALVISTPAAAEEAVLNLYSARHYQVDEALYEDFEQQTGIRINRIEGNEQQLLERILQEGANSPADVFITVDAARLAQAEAYGVFAPTGSAYLDERIPAHLRSNTWYAFSTRARVIIYDKRKLKAADVPSYESLADPRLKGLVCSRSGAHPYNLTLVASMVSANGLEATEQWARGVVANFARDPKGGDLDQIMEVATGRCGVAVSNTYYIARLLDSDKVEERNLVRQRVGIVWPNQADRGTHVNVSGGGMVKTTRHREAAIRFLEYLASDAAQRHFANGNNEWPAVASVTVDNEALEDMGQFRADTRSLVEISAHLVEAQKLLDRAGYR